MPIVMLDSNPLSLISNPRNKGEPFKCRNRIQQLVSNNIPVIVPEIIDYELRRKLIYDKRKESIERLDRLAQEMGIIYAPITTEVMRKASALWGWARATGQSTAHENQIDIDVILAAQSIILAMETEEYVIIATPNIKDLRRYSIDAQEWNNITVEYCLNPNPQKLI